jgi:hypothetical protein
MVTGYLGSERHKQYKRKVANVLRQYGYKVAGDHDDEFSLVHDADSWPFSCDLIAASDTRVIVVEIDGYRGHSSHRAILKDKHRFDSIKRALYSAECYRFAFFQLKNTDDKLIAQELGLTL